jgi:hypothetical protein
VQRSTSSAQCWKDVIWPKHGLPKQARPVVVHLGAVTSGIAFRLGRLASPSTISGRITNPSGAGVAHAIVEAFRPGGRVENDVTADGHGRYHLSVEPSPKVGYFVCAFARRQELADAAGHAAPQQQFGARCWKHVPWAGAEAPKAAPVVKIAHGQTRRGIGITLPRAGNITGFATFEGQPVFDVEVLVFDAAHRFVTAGFTDENGKYTVSGLSPLSHEYEVCYATPFSDSTTVSPTYGFRPQCFRNQPWDESGIFF